MHRLLVSIVAGMLFLIPQPLPAGDGAVPIWEPTTITQPGKYVVTRDISQTAAGYCDPVITITASDVDLDLNGHTIGDPYGSGIQVSGPLSGLDIHDGTIKALDCDQIALLAYDVTQFTIRRIHAWGIDGGMTISGDTGVVEDNTVEGIAIGINVGGSGVGVQRNHIRDAGMQINCNSCVVSENTVLDSQLTVRGPGNLILNNVVSGSSYDGIVVYLDGDHNHIEDNLLTGNAGFGLHFTEFLGDTGDHNTYRRNTARNNGGTGCTSPSATSDFCDDGTDNTSGGGNFMPDEM